MNVFFILHPDYDDLDEAARRDVGRRWVASLGGYPPPPPEKDCPPRPEDNLCQCCGDSAQLLLDHCHDTGAFRGWVCNSCNSGAGIMDNVERLEKRIIFLKAHALIRDTHLKLVNSD